MKQFLYFIAALIILGALFFDFYDRQQPYPRAHANLWAAEQEPRRWHSADTLWWEIDSLPALPSPEAMDSLQIAWDSLHGVWHPPLQPIANKDNVHSAEYTPAKAAGLDFRLPYWNVYRRSITRWGITFSTGQPNPYNPYPQSNALNAAVDSHPLNRPR